MTDFSTIQRKCLQKASEESDFQEQFGLFVGWLRQTAVCEHGQMVFILSFLFSILVKGISVFQKEKIKIFCFFSHKVSKHLKIRQVNLQR